MAIRATQRIQARSYFPQFRDTLHKAAREGVEQGGIRGAHAARAAAPVGDGVKGVMKGHMADTIKPLTVAKSRNGYRGGFGSPDPTLMWLSLGTFGRRTKANQTRARHGKQSKNFRAEHRRTMLRHTETSRTTKVNRTGQTVQKIKYGGRTTGIKPQPWAKRALIQIALPAAIEHMRTVAGRKLRG